MDMSRKATGVSARKILTLLLIVCMTVALCPVAGFAAVSDISGHWAEADIKGWVEA